MRYYKQYDETGNLLMVGIGYDGEEITEAEYHEILSEIREKVSYVHRVYAGEISIDDVPEAWREFVQAEVEIRSAAAEDEEATVEDYLAALAELGVTE